MHTAWEAWFPRADWDGAGVRPLPCAVCEPAAADRRAPFTERHLHGVWYDARLRPEGLVTSGGERLFVEHPGDWNTGPGPDFLNAVLVLAPDMRRISGDVEVHTYPVDWERHRHAADPRYRNVCLHLTYFPGLLPAAALPPGALQVALKPALDAVPSFAFDNMDLMAYPVAARVPQPPCQREMKKKPAAVCTELLASAGETRLRLRAQALGEAIRERGGAQVLYEETLAALGYRGNKAPFRLLARLMPLAELRALSGGSVTRAYAILAGLAGLLPDPSQRGRRDEETRAFLRACWDAWWPLSTDYQTRVIPRAAWNLAGIRPANRPERRLMAAAQLFASPNGLPEKLAALQNGPASLARLKGLFDLAAAPYWPRRLSFDSPPQNMPVALIGAARAHALLINLVFPFLAATSAAAAGWQPLLAKLPAEEANQVIRLSAERFFGADHAPRLYRSGLCRQGLIHLHHTYCLGDRTACASCPLPQALAAFPG